MELFDTDFVYLGEALLILGLKMLVTSDRYIYISGKIMTVPRLFSEHLLQNENKHQIMNVHTKWNCLIPILSTLVKYYLFQVLSTEARAGLLA